MDVFTVAFFGHRVVENIIEVEKSLEEYVEKIMLEKNYVEFLVGRNGEFDKLVASVINKKRKQLRDDNNSLTLVLPFLTAEYLNNKENFEKYYGEIEVFESEKTIHFKAIIRKRNEYMIKKSNLVVCYVNKNFGGAYEAIKYAQKCGKEIYKV